MQFNRLARVTLIQIQRSSADIRVSGYSRALTTAPPRFAVSAPLASNGPEQRRQARRVADHAIRVSPAKSGPRQSETARMVDISEGGMCFVGSRYLTPGSAVQIEFAGCRIVAEVRHCRLREYGSLSQYFTGVQVQQILEGEETWRALTEQAD